MFIQGRQSRKEAQHLFDIDRWYMIACILRFERMRTLPQRLQEQAEICHRLSFCKQLQYREYKMQRYKPTASLSVFIVMLSLVICPLLANAAEGPKKATYVNTLVGSTATPLRYMCCRRGGK